jgi:predicted TIM-barrel fold metal-dependent hydrolase
VISQPLADGLTGGGVPASTAEDLIGRLDEANIERAVVLSLGYFNLPDDSNMAPENDFTASIVAEAPDRLIGFCGINPRYDSALSEIDRCLALPEMVGIKLNIVGGSGLDWENPEHATAISAVLGSAQAHDAPVLMHVAAAPLDDDSLLSALAVIGSHPDLRLLIAHCGGDADYEIEQYLIPASAVPPLISLDNLYTDVSSCLDFYRDAPRSQRELIVWRLRKWGIDNVFLGSDYLSIAPAETPAEALETLARYPFTREEINTILNNDASAWLVGS